MFTSATPSSKQCAEHPIGNSNVPRRLILSRCAASRTSARGPVLAESFDVNHWLHSMAPLVDQVNHPKSPPEMDNAIVGRMSAFGRNAARKRVHRRASVDLDGLPSREAAPSQVTAHAGKASADALTSVTNRLASRGCSSASISRMDGSVDSSEGGTARSSWHSATPMGFATPLRAYSATSRFFPCTAAGQWSADPRAPSPAHR